MAWSIRKHRPSSCTSPAFATGLPSDPTELVEGGGLPGPVADGPEDLEGALEALPGGGVVPLVQVDGGEVVQGWWPPPPFADGPEDLESCADSRALFVSEQPKRRT